jgi:hypothetical protein
MAEYSLSSNEQSEGKTPNVGCDADKQKDEMAENERVALIKSLATNNRFYILVSEASDIQNADTVPEIPHDSLLGIAYPCLEDGLNDFAVIRTAFETLELFPGDEGIHHELGEIIHDTRCNLIRRLMELLERLIALKAYFLGTDLEQFKSNALELMHRGFPRHDLDRMMKVNIFSSVANAENSLATTTLEADANGPQAIYRYEFHNSDSLERLISLPPRDFLIALFSDVLDSVLDENNYASKGAFDRHVFQQFIALMFVSYASTDSVFYGTHKDDYGVSRSKSMDDTPLYQAIKAELRRISITLSTNDLEKQGAENRLANAQTEDGESNLEETNFFALKLIESPHAEPKSPVHLPDQMADEDALLRPIASISALALQLQKHYHGNNANIAQLILTEASLLVQEMKRLGIISPLASDPSAFTCAPTIPTNASYEAINSSHLTKSQAPES